MNSMPRAMPMLVPAILLLAACTPTATDAATPPITPAATVSLAATPPAQSIAGAPTPAARGPAADAGGASIRGAIRDGNRPPPALRVCATPVSGGTPTCIDTEQGASEYRIDVAPGRYYLLGWVQSGELKLIAHASQIRCIRAPCPPDELIEVSVSEGQQVDGVDLGAGYADIPAGWPQRAP